ncbi:hypothetical protein [Saccharopolyspora phatthalungensis]|uniref:hypothetical protein n=1 Tax=Saccharopolyspora phatthalungensis TaxID=664693 RepID=UPI0028ACED7A|nr:hypothetical protein [Saccharopolyspora phatthalungensis]
MYGSASALVFGKLFFPEVSPALGTLAAFGTFWVGFLARPLGGLIFGHIGDRRGRKSALIMTLALMGLATAGIGVLPTPSSCSRLAPWSQANCRSRARCCGCCCPKSCCFP